MTFNLITATATASDAVDLLFDANVDTSGSLAAMEALSPTSYTFTAGLVSLGVLSTGATTLRVYTTPQHVGVVYQVAVVGAVVDVAAHPLTGRVAMFNGAATLLPYTVGDLTARTDCRGARVHLTWSLPAPGNNRVRVYRRTRSWPFEPSDPSDLVYDRITPAGPTAFEDTGIAEPITTLAVSVASGSTTITVGDATGLIAGHFVRVENPDSLDTYDVVRVQGVVGNVVTFALPLKHAYDSSTTRVAASTELLEQTFYYYLVVAQNPATGAYDVAPACRVWALSIEKMNSKDDFFWRVSPAVDQERDSPPLAESGGGGFLDKWFSVMGCWLNLLRGWANSIKTMNDPDQAPYHVLAAQNLSLGTTPEGLSYDFNIPRRSLMSLVYVYKRKGSCEGIIEAVRMFTLWDAQCISFGNGEGGPSPFKTWNGTSGEETHTGAPPAVVLSNRLLHDGGQAWAASLWKEGVVFGAIGDVAIVADNTATDLVLAPAPGVTTLAGTVLAGANVVPVASTVGLVPHLTIQLESKLTPLVAEIAEILTVQPGVSVTLTNGVGHGYVVGDKVAIGKSLIRTEYLGATNTLHAGAVLLDPKASWPVNAWVGYKLLDQGNTLHNVISSTLSTVTVDGPNPPDGQYAIAFDFTVGGNFAARVPVCKYTVYNGDHYRLFEPTLNIAARATFYDPYSYLWQGPGSSILGAWGSGDLGIYILTSVAQAIGKASTVMLNVLTLDLSAPPPAVNALVGMMLNPNQNQESLFRIVANSATTVTVDRPIASLVVPGQVYYVLKPRDAAKFSRISKRLRREFAHPDITTHVLFQ